MNTVRRALLAALVVGMGFGTNHVVWAASEAQESHESTTEGGTEGTAGEAGSGESSGQVIQPGHEGGEGAEGAAEGSMGEGAEGGQEGSEGSEGEGSSSSAGSSSSSNSSSSSSSSAVAERTVYTELFRISLNVSGASAWIAQKGTNANLKTLAGQIDQNQQTLKSSLIAVAQSKGLTPFDIEELNGWEVELVHMNAGAATDKFYAQQLSSYLQQTIAALDAMAPQVQVDFKPFIQQYRANAVATLSQLQAITPSL